MGHNLARAPALVRKSERGWYPAPPGLAPESISLQPGHPMSWVPIGSGNAAGQIEGGAFLFSCRGRYWIRQCPDLRVRGSLDGGSCAGSPEHCEQ